MSSPPPIIPICVFPILVIPSCGKQAQILNSITNEYSSYSSGRAYSPRLLFMWPNAKIGVMGSEQLSAVMATVGKTDPALRDRIDHESRAEFSSARLWDDGVIPPAQTRRVLGLGLAAALGGKADEVQTKFGVFRM